MAEQNPVPPVAEEATEPKRPGIGEFLQRSAECIRERAESCVVGR